MNLGGDHLYRQREKLVLGAALLIPLGLSAAFIPLRSTFTNVAAALCMIAVIEAVAILGGRVAGVIATVSAALWFDFLLTPPYEHLTISRRPDIETTVAIILVGIAVTELAARARHHRHIAGEESRYVAMLHDVAELCSGTAEVSDATQFVTNALIDVLELRACRFDSDVSEPPLAQVQLRGDVVHVGLEWPASDIGLPGPEAEILCRYRGEVVGRFVLTPTPGLAIAREQRVVAASMANLVAPIIRDARIRRTRP